MASQKPQLTTASPNFDEYDSDKTGESEILLPAALPRNKDALLTAFRACKNIKEVEFCDYHVFDKEDATPTQHPKPRLAVFPGPRHKSRQYACDITSSFDFILSLMSQADLTPRWISIHPLSYMRMSTGLIDAASLLEHKHVLRKVESLELRFIHDWRNDEAASEETSPC